MIKNKLLDLNLNINDLEKRSPIPSITKKDIHTNSIHLSSFIIIPQNVQAKQSGVAHLALLLDWEVQKVYTVINFLIILAHEGIYDMSLNET